MSTYKNLPNVIVGTTPISKDSEQVRDAFIKINNNFNELYSGGQFIANESGTEKFPGYTWETDKSTGFFHAGKGKIGVALAGAEYLLMDALGSIKWKNAELATQEFVKAKINEYTGGLSGGSVSINAGEGAVNVTLNGIPVVESLPTQGNYMGRIAYYNGDVWTFTNYPQGNGRNQSANPEIAREQNSDFRWVRFRGESTLATGRLKPDSAPDGTSFYETTSGILYFHLGGKWKTLSSLVSNETPAGLEILRALPSKEDPNNYLGRTVVVGNTAYIFNAGDWKRLSDYIVDTPAGIYSGNALPDKRRANIGDLFRKTDRDAGLYIFDGLEWVTIQQYSASQGTARIKTLPRLPYNVTLYNVGDLINVGNKIYILGENKTKWNLFTPGADSIMQGVALNPGQVTEQEIANGSITNDKILARTLSADKLQLNSITANELADGIIDNNKLAANSITGSRLLDSSITGDKVVNNSIPGEKIVDGSITSDKLAKDSIAVSRVRADYLSDLSRNAGTIMSGKLQSQDGKFVIDLTNKFIRIEL